MGVLDTLKKQNEELIEEIENLISENENLKNELEAYIQGTVSCSPCKYETEIKHLLDMHRDDNK